MQQPLVSILIPVYNADKKIAKAIISCIKQTYANTEIIVLNDGSTDFTIGELDKYEIIRVIKHDKNLGTSVSRNDLIKAAKGEFIAWMDADDTMLPTRIERQVKFMQENPGIDIAGSWVLTNNSTFPKKKVPLDSGIIKEYLWFKNCMVHSSIICRNFYQKDNIFYNEDLRSNVEDDVEIWYRLSKTKVLANMPEFLTSIHLPLIKDVQMKHTLRQFELELHTIWEKKWKDISVSLEEKQMRVIQDFLYNIDQLSYDQLMLAKTVLGTLKTKANTLVVDYYRCLIYIRLNFRKRFFNLDLLSSMWHYSALKRKHLVQ